MKIEFRSDNEIRVSGYVNAVERDSRVLPPEMAAGEDKHFVERVSAGVFARAIKRHPDVRLYFNHERELGSVSGGTLTLTEDNIGLYAEATVTDPEVIAAARANKLRGWSFGFENARAQWEDAGGGTGLRRRIITDLDLDEVSILTKCPAYAGTSISVRALSKGAVHTVVCEQRTADDEPPIVRAEQKDIGAKPDAEKATEQAQAKRALLERQLEILRFGHGR